MTPRRRTWLVVTAPLVAIATLMIGLRVGAGDEFHAALVYIAAPGQPVTPGAPAPYAWQLMTYLEDRGVRETIAMKNLSAVARTVDGQESRWQGESNEDGIAELHFAFAKTPAKIGIEVRTAGENEPLALGIVDINDAPIPQHPSAAEVEQWGLRPSQKSGLPLQVFVEGEQLAVGAAGSIWVHVPPPATMVHTLPEIGVEFAVDDSRPTCGEWAELHATALQQAASTLIEAKDDSGKLIGRWFGVIPTAPGGFEVHVPRLVHADQNEVLFIAPNPRTTVYMEIDDEQGREFGAVLPLAVEAGDPMPKAHLTLPSLAPGPHWLVTSGNPRGAEKMSGATLARTFVVGDPSSAPQRRECELGIAAAKHIAIGFPRTLAIDGIATRGARNRARHRQGLFIGLLALAAAALLEVLLLTAAAREARHALELAANENAKGVTTKTPGGGLIVALLVAVLGFALLGVLMIAKA